MRKILLTLIIVVCFIELSFAQLQVDAGPVFFIKDQFWKPDKNNISFDYNVSVGYNFNSMLIGLEYFQNNAMESGYDPYSFNQFNFFVRNFPLKRKNLFWSGSLGAAYENRTYETRILNWENEQTMVTSEFGDYFALGVEVGYEDRLIRNKNLYVNIALCYNYYIETNSNYFHTMRTGDPFYALKLRLIYKWSKLTD
ncbi:MAG: hypothetical protein PF541_02990 [Prolixibacteraceae bacterium]|jgi:hypothetical protein|nr:hypothetical protein [Prolixibacteraceae bacterium]